MRLKKGYIILGMTLIISISLFIVCSYNKSHTNFKVFWSDFSYSVLNDEKKAVLKMVNFPFIDGFNKIYRPDETFTAHNESEFLEKYDSLFDEQTKKAIEQFRIEKQYNFLGKEEYVLISDIDNNNKDLIFKRVKKRFKLTGIKYYP